MQLTQARSAALELAQESHLPQYDRFLTYLMGTTDIHSDYPLQAVRMVWRLTAQGASGRETVTPSKTVKSSRLALLCADTGFRTGMAGPPRIHTLKSPPTSLKGFRFLGSPRDWKRLIMTHHSEKEDSSPMRILSLIAQYLGMVYGTGIDEIGQPLISPCQSS